MSQRITRRELVELLEIEEAFVVELEQHEVITVVDGRYDRRAIERVRVSWSMHRSLGVNHAGLAVALDLLERWQGERRRVRELLERLRDHDEE